MRKILDGIKIDRAMDQVNEHPELWNRYDMRTTMFKDSPHREVSDIWLRYRDYSEFDADNPMEFANQHTSIWYAAAHVLTDVIPIIEKVFSIVDGDELGGCLITKIPPGKQVYRHSDAGAWHSEYYLSKYLIPLQSAPGQTFNFDEESHEAEPGDLFIFDNRPEHWVINNSDIDRVSLILAIRQRSHNE